MSDQTEEKDDQSLMTHLIELRDRLLRSVLVIIVLLAPLLYFGNELYTLLAKPLLRHMPAGTTMIATEVASPFLTPFKLSLVSAIFLAVPYLLYQTWAFIAPGLYQHERKLVVPLLASSTVLFYTGIAFAYYVVFPLVFGFFIGVAPEGVTVMTDIAKYLDFVLKLFLAFGVAFEVPIATILICWTGMTTPDKLAEKRAYVIVAAFVIGMLLTPPDVISQTLLALPMWLLFEVGIFFARRMPKRDNTDEDERGENSIGGDAAVAATVASSTLRPETGVTEEDVLEEVDLDEEQELDEEDMDAELDRMEAEEDELNKEDQAVDENSAEKPGKPDKPE